MSIIKISQTLTFSYPHENLKFLKFENFHQLIKTFEEQLIFDPNQFTTSYILCDYTK